MDVKNSIMFKFRFPSGRDYLLPVIRFILHEIKSTRIPTTLSEEELRLIIDESITNAMEHGNRWDRNKKVEVTMERCKKGFQLTVEDEGVGFSLIEAPASLAKISGRGRGLQLMKEYCNCRWNDKGNIMTMFIPVQ